MSDNKLFDGEYKFMSLIWDNEPIKSTALHNLADQLLGWKKSTTYTMIRKLSKKGLISNDNTIVTSLIKREDVQKSESLRVVDKLFNNSLPSFVSAFLSDKKISKDEAEKLKELIEEATK